MLADIGQYIADLADNWAAFMTGGIAAALILVIERLRKNQLPARTFIVFLVFGFIAASFMTWRHEHMARLIAEQNSTKARNAAIVHQLQEYYGEAESYYLQANGAASEQEYKETEKAAHEWAIEMGNWITINMGKGAYARLIQTPERMPTFDNAKPGRAELLYMLVLVRENLGKLVENGSWDRP